MSITVQDIENLAAECGFELAGVAAAVPLPEALLFQDWAARGMAGEMTYVTDRRAAARLDPRSLLPSAKSVICVGKLYNEGRPVSARLTGPERGWISRYAWGDDYHGLMRESLKSLVERLRGIYAEPFEYRVCVDTAPLLERAYARRAGLGWIGKNTCLIDQKMGSWFFLGELLVSLEIPPGSPPPDRCGSCTCCIDACPTKAIVPAAGPNGPRWQLDARLCISYLTIELRGAVPEALRPLEGNHIFGCDICQDVCPWNRKAPVTAEPAFSPEHLAPSLKGLAALGELEFARLFRESPVKRPKYGGFLRNVAVAMGNAGLSTFRASLRRLAASHDAVVAEHARWALARLK